MSLVEARLLQFEEHISAKILKMTTLQSAKESMLEQRIKALEAQLSDLIEQLQDSQSIEEVLEQPVLQSSPSDQKQRTQVL